MVDRRNGAQADRQTQRGIASGFSGQHGNVVPVSEFVGRDLVMSAIIDFIQWLVSIVLAANDQREWDDFHQDAFEEACAEFDAIFESLTVTSKQTPKGIRVTVKRPNGRIARSNLVKAA